MDHDHQLIDIDSGTDIFHFKTTHPNDFKKWTSFIEKYSQSEDNQSLMLSHNALNKTGSTDNTLMSKASIEFDADFDEMNAYLNRLLNSLGQEVTKLQGLIHTCKGRADIKNSPKEFNSTLSSLCNLSDSISDQVKKTQNYMGSYSSHLQMYKDKISASLQIAENAFISCLKDNNRTRKDYGLDLVHFSDFLPPGFNQSDIFSNLNNRHERSGSYASASLDEFYDAEQGDDYSDSNSSSTSADEDEDSSSLRYLNRNESLLEETSSEFTDSNSLSKSHSKKLSLLSAIEKGDASASPLDDSFSIQVPSIMDSIVRRTRLPHPTVSMENLSIMSILRSNVSSILILVKDSYCILSVYR